MGMFDLFNNLLDENSENSLENKLLGGIDKLEQTLGQALDKAEEGITKAGDAFDKLENTSNLAEEKVKELSENPEQTLGDSFKKL
jgi:hypothetical protein